MNKSDIVTVLKAIKKHCKNEKFCSNCVFNSWCCGCPFETTEKEINDIANKIKEVINNE